MCDTSCLTEVESIENYEKDDCDRMEVEPAQNSRISPKIDTSGTDSPSPNSSERTKRSNSVKLVISTARFTRSRDNPEFVARQKNFMAQVQAANAGISGDIPVNIKSEISHKRRRDSSVNSHQAKKKKVQKSVNLLPAPSTANDNACWECHRDGQFICCELCPRSFHLKCAGLDKEPEDDWACRECYSMMLAESPENRSKALQLITVDQFGALLRLAINRFKTSPSLAPFFGPVDTNEFPTYNSIVMHPVDLQTLEENIKNKFYCSTEAFIAEAKWIVHNSVLFNGANSKITSLARSLIKTLKQELNEIETCPDCYLNAHENPENWFTEACRLAHPLIWARLKGFPFWPAKAVKWKEGNVDARFFGRHDRSWIPLKDCYLYSEQMPTPLKSRNKTLETCLIEVNRYIDKLKEKFGTFSYAPHKTSFDPYDPDQIKLLLPNYQGPPIIKIRPVRSNAISGQSDDDASSTTSSDSVIGTSRKSKTLKESLIVTTEVETTDDIARSTPEANVHNTDNVIEQSNESPVRICKVETVISGPPVKRNLEDSSLLLNQTPEETVEPLTKQNGLEPGQILENREEQKSDVKPEETAVTHTSEVVEGDSKCDTKLEVNSGETKNTDDAKCDKESDESLVVSSSEEKMDKSESDKEHISSEISDEKKVPDIKSDLEAEHGSEFDGSEKLNLLLSDNELNESMELEPAVENGGANDLPEKTDFVSENADHDDDESLVSDDDLEKLMIDETAKTSDSVKSPPKCVVDENIRNLQRINELLASDTDKTEQNNKKDSSNGEQPSASEVELTEFRRTSSDDEFHGFPIDDVAAIDEKASKVSEISKSVDLSKVGDDIETNSSTDQSDHDIDAKLPNSISIRRLASTDSSITENCDEPSNATKDETKNTPEKSPSEELQQLSKTNVTDFMTMAGKIFHNITITSNKTAEERTSEPTNSSTKPTDKSDHKSKGRTSDKLPDFLSEAARIVKNCGTVAIKRLDNKTLEHTSGSDKVTISMANQELIKPKKEKDRIRKQSTSPTSGTQSKMEADKDENIKMPSGVDTTRLSPSISIIPVGNNDQDKIRKSLSFSSPSSTQQSNVSSSSVITTSVPASSNTSLSLSIPPPPLLSHPSNSQGVRFFSPMQPPRTSIAPAGMRMLAANPGMLLHNRLPGNVMRHMSPEAGPLSAELGKQSLKIADIVRVTIEDILNNLCNSGNPEAKITALQLELEKTNWRHQQELADLRHNADLLMVEMRTTLEAERQRSVDEVRKQMELKFSEVRRQYDAKLSDKIAEVKRQSEVERQREIEETKRKQWCANCNKEALFFCCWNTSYCDYPCQQAHWPQHMSVCGQNNSDSNGNPGAQDSASENLNGDISNHSSRVPTPIQNQQGIDDEEGRHSVEERRRKRKRENPSPLFSDVLGTTSSPGNMAGMCNTSSSSNPMAMSPLGTSQRPMMSPGLGMVGGSSNQNLQLQNLQKIPRFMQHSMIQPQPPMFGMDPRMMLLMGRNINNSAMLRGHMQPYRPRFM